MYEDKQKTNTKNEEIKDNEESTRKIPTYYTTLPWQIRYDNRLKPNEKILYSEILLLSKRNGYCSAQNSYFAELYSVSTGAISKWINGLKKSGYINVIINFKEDGKTFDERRIYINNIDSLVINEPIVQKDHTPIQKDHTPPYKRTRPYSSNELDPIVQKDQHNKINANKIKANKINDDYKEKIKNHWNSISDLNKIEYLSPTRENSIENLINDYGLEKIEQAIDLIPKSNYLLGKTKTRTESVSFDWFIKPDNFIKVLEGAYSNHKKEKDEYFYDFETNWESEESISNNYKKSISNDDKKKIINAWNKKYKGLEILFLNVTTEQRLGELVSQCGIDKVIKAIESKEMDNSKYDEIDILEDKPFIELVYSEDFEKSIGYIKPEYEDSSWTDEALENDYLNIKRL